jgi:hypothetical protein
MLKLQPNCRPGKSPWPYPLQCGQDCGFHLCFQCLFSGHRRRPCRQVPASPRARSTDAMRVPPARSAHYRFTTPERPGFQPAMARQCGPPLTYRRHQPASSASPALAVNRPYARPRDKRDEMDAVVFVLRDTGKRRNWLLSAHSHRRRVNLAQGPTFVPLWPPRLTPIQAGPRHHRHQALACRTGRAGGSWLKGRV